MGAFFVIVNVTLKDTFWIITGDKINTSKRRPQKRQKEKNMKTIRINEIINQFHSFNKECYHKTELLPELFALQSELVEVVFEGDDVDKTSLKIWDVEKRLAEMNAECGGVVTEQLRFFETDCKYICNLIKAEISGNRGENKAFESLSHIRGEHTVLRNIELSNGSERSELDAVVITRNGAFIIEVKNTSKNIFIDSEGNYYRTGEFLKWDSNIGEKMRIKRDLLRGVLDSKGLTYMPIYEVVVFTNNRVEIQNKCATLKTCFLSQLPYIIDRCREIVFSFDEMDLAIEAISAANKESYYPLDFDVDSFKNNFADILATLELAKAKKSSNWFKTMMSFVGRKATKYAASAAMFAFVIVSAIGLVRN